MALDPCPHCNKEFDHDNAGARTQHINSCKKEAEKYTQNHPDTSDGSGNTGEVRQPAQSAQTPQRADATQQDTQMVADDTTAEAVQTGMQVGSMLSSMGAGTPEEKAESQGQLLTAVGSTVAQLGQQFTQKRKEDIDRAKNASQENVGVVEDYVDCPECGAQITDLPEPGSQFRCPGCDTLLESK